MKNVIFGCGYLGRRLASALLRQGAGVTAVVRSPASRRGLERAGITALALDLDRVSRPPPLTLAGSDLFYLVPPPRDGDRDLRVAALLRLFQTCGQPRRLVYLGTTGVYGDCGGAWVDEQRPVAPVVPRALRRWDAEQRFREWRRRGGGELVILRVAGIYGPDKLPLDRLRKGLPVIREEEAPYSNRIHIDDLVQSCLAAMARGADGAVYNVSDGHPSTMTDYFLRIAERAGLPPPPRIALADGDGRLSPGMMSYMRESRRLDNRRLRQELGVVLQYPTLDDGLAACFGSPGASPPG